MKPPIFSLRTPLIAVAILVTIFNLLPSKAEFDPYQLNGGLISAVAGKGYVIVAADTRLSRGYEILTRTHISSRIWKVGRSNSFIVCNSNTHSNNNGKQTNSDPGGGIITYKQPVINVHDGAFIASAGCSSDCEALKRRMQMDVRAHTDWNSGGSLSVTGIATALGHTLYSRRGFPYYSFCIVAGMESSSDEKNNNVGVVHVYDAIGSHERVAVAAAGNGREMLQPILDRFFSVSNLRQLEQDTDDDYANSYSTTSKDGSAIAAKHQRVGLSLNPPVKTFVECSCEGRLLPRTYSILLVKLTFDISNYNILNFLLYFNRGSCATYTSISGRLRT
jgi:20S proteasome subunit beta 6